MRITTLNLIICFSLLLGKNSFVYSQEVFDESTIYERMYRLLAQPGEEQNGQCDIYGADQNTTDFIRCLFLLNDITSDNAVCGLDDVGIYELITNTWDTSTPQLKGIFLRLAFGIYTCNFYLENAPVSQVQRRAEARFLRALCYYYMLDLFGNVPISTSTTSSLLDRDSFSHYMGNAQREVLPQNSREDVFNFVENELLACAEDMVAPTTATYGRADRSAAWFLLARLYLNAEVYTGTAKWQKAWEYAQKVIDTNAYNIWIYYPYLFMGDNDTNGSQREVIMPIVQSPNSGSWGGTTFLIAACYDSSMGNGLNQKWSGIRARKSLVNKFTKYDKRSLFYSFGHSLGISHLNSFHEGYGVTKWTNVRVKPPQPTSAQFADTDFPLFRSAEMLLTAAEADARLNGGATTAAGASFVTQLRLRASTTYTKNSYTLDDLSDEWCREFYFEGQRRTTLIRFGQYTGDNYLWDWKGGIQEGKAIGHYRALFPLPDFFMKLSSDYRQNSGYDDINITPKDLVMNVPAYANEAVELKEVQGLWFSWRRPTNISSERFLTYALQLSASADFLTNIVQTRADNTEKLLFDASTLYENMGRWGIADGETATLYARVSCHNAVSEPISFSVRRSQVMLNPHPWYITGSPIGDGDFDIFISGLGKSNVPLGVIDDNTFRFSGYFNTDGVGFYLFGFLGNWTPHVGSTWNSIDDYSFVDVFSGMHFNEPGNYSITLHYDGEDNYLFYSKLDDDLPVYSSMSIIGSFSNWTDVDMTQVEGVKHSWYITKTFTEDTELKFRGNHEWTYNWGAESFPYGQGVKDSNNIQVKAGTYAIFFNDITGDYLFLDANTGELPKGEDDLVDDKYLNMEYATIQVEDNVTYNADDTTLDVQILNTTDQSVHNSRLYLGKYELSVDENGMVSRELLSDAISQLADAQVEYDFANNLRKTKVQAFVRGYVDKDELCVYTESSPFTIVMTEDYNFIFADAYYLLGDMNSWQINNHSWPLTKEREGVYYITFTQLAYTNVNWFIVMPSTTINWDGDFIRPCANGIMGIGEGSFKFIRDGENAWSMPFDNTDKTYTFVLDFSTMKYSLFEGNMTDINSASKDILSTGSIFNLQGMKMKDMTRSSIYIVNGRKVIVK